MVISFSLDFSLDFSLRVASVCFPTCITELFLWFLDYEMHRWESQLTCLERLSPSDLRSRISSSFSARISSTWAWVIRDAASFGYLRVLTSIFIRFFSQLQSDSSFSAKRMLLERQSRNQKTAKRFFPLQKWKEEIMLVCIPAGICRSRLSVCLFPPWLAEASFPSTTTFEWTRQTTDWPLGAWHCFVLPHGFGWNI